MSSATATLTPAQRALLAEARRATLATIKPDGRSRLVPITYAFDPEAELLYFALDEKPKAVDDPRRLARVRDMLERPQVSVLVDRWSEDWSELAWVRLDGEATLLEPADHAEEHAAALHMLRERYPQYAAHDIERRPVIRIEINNALSWGL